MLMKIEKVKEEEIGYNKLLEIYQGWQAYAKWANSYKLRKNIFKIIQSTMQFNLLISNSLLGNFFSIIFTSVSCLLL